MSKDLYKQVIDSTISQDTKQRNEALRQIIAQKAAEIVSRSNTPGNLPDKK